MANELGRATTYAYTDPSRDMLQTFPNPAVQRYTVRFHCTEVTALCPQTGQPDYYRLDVWFTPSQTCLESKSMKLYLGAYRMVGNFIEQMAHRIYDDLQAVLAPHEMTVRLEMQSRGGIVIVATVSSRAQA